MTGRFRTRPTRPLAVWSINGWRLKAYEITLDGTPIVDEVLEAVGRLLRSSLPRSNSDGLGFAVVHHGAEQVWVLADLWSGDIVSQHTFFAELDTPTAFSRVPPGGPTACVWELAVHAHEREAFITHVLDPVDGPDCDAYLADTIAIAGEGVE